MSENLYRNPISPIQALGVQSVNRAKTYGTNFSVLGTGGFMEVYNLSDLVFNIPVGQTGTIEFTGNTIPIQFSKGTGAVFSPDILTLNSDNISSGRRRLGMLAYVYETDKIYQFHINNYDHLWSAATGSSGVGGATVVISDFGTTVKNNSVAGQNFINAWTASTIEGIDGYTNLDASWRELKTGGGASGDYLPLSGGTVTGDTIFQSGLTANTISATTYFNLPTDIYTTGFTFNVGNYDLTLHRNGGLPDLTQNLSILASDVTITGGSYNINTGEVTLENNTGGTITITGFASGYTDTVITAFTYSSNTLTIGESTGGLFETTINSFTGLTIDDLTATTITAATIYATTISATTYENLPIDQNTYITGFTYDNANTLTISDNSGSTFNATINEVTGLTVNGILSATTISATTISATTYQNLPGQFKKIVLRKVELGTRNVTEVSVVTNLKNILDNREIYDILTKTSSYTGTKVDYYYTINDYNDNQRKKVLWTTQTIGVDYDSFSVFYDMCEFIIDYGVYDSANFYVELYLLLDNEYSAPTQMKLVNPLYSSLNPNKYSAKQNYTGRQEFIRNEKYNPLSNNNTDLNTIYSDFQYQPKIDYYDTTTSQDIPKKIYDIVNESNFYGVLSGNAQTVINVGSWDNDVRDVIKNSVYVEPIKNFYSKFKIPVNLNGFYNVNQNKLNNFYGNLLFDIASGSSLVFSANSNTTAYTSTTFAQFIDTYRIYPEGNFGYIFYSADTENNTLLNDLSYSVGSNRFLKYTSKKDTTGGYKEYGSYIQVLPGFNETYSLKLSFSGTPTTGITSSFVTDIFQNYVIVNDYSVNKNNNFWNNIIDESSNNLYNQIIANSEGSFNMILQSKDTKMLELSQNPVFTYTSSTISIDAIYKGHSFRPLLYPLNLTQLLLEVPQSFFYDGSTLQPTENSNNNLFEYSGNDITNKKLCLIINYKKLNKYDIVQENLVWTQKRGLNNINTLMIQNIEKTITQSISHTKAKELRPGSVEIYFSFLDINTNTLSIIPNYKIIIVKYGENEIFKVIRDDVEFN